ncbi:uncharacterized protein LOC113866108 [Abrus precatorius]|uniref:Uncharacterized protein LOC113866108 n=1 Tax=Abrus precatorius TaxID=3816 RepID=A0A8B8LLG5_ABRPR|nr:uncharacterized protein LOC113866108 [Abrus precatorius]
MVVLKWQTTLERASEEDLCVQFQHRFRREILVAVNVFQLTDLLTLSWTNCDNCGKLRHTVNVCLIALKKSGSASISQRPESRGSTGLKPSIPGKVFAISRADASQSEELIRGKCVVKGILLDVLFDSGATQSFVSMDYVKCLDLHVIELLCNVVVTNPTSKPVISSWVCLGYSVIVYSRDFDIDLICLPSS